MYITNGITNYFKFTKFNYRNFAVKKVLCIIITVFILISNPIYYSNAIVYAEVQSTEIQIELSEEIAEQLINLDTSEIDALFGEYVDASSPFTSGSFKDKVKDLINGNLNLDTSSFISFIGSFFIEEILAFLPIICLVIAIAVLYSMLSGFAKQNNVSSVLYFVCYGAIVGLILISTSGIIKLASNALYGIKSQMEAIFPLLLSVLTALGGTASASIYQPAMAVLCNIVVTIFTNILLPIFIFKLVFNIISNISPSLKFNKFADFFGSCFKWIIGLVLTIFSAVVSIQGLMAGSIDGISIKTAKYTIKGSVPIVGGFIADGMGLILISSSLIKNAIGVGGLILLFSTILMPVVKVVVFSLLLKLASAILEPIADSKICSFVTDISKSIAHIIALILGVAFMYFILVGLVMCSANIF